MAWLTLLILPALPAAPAMALAAQSPDPSEDSGGEALLAQAREALWAGREAAAVPLFRQYLGHRPQDGAARLDLARALAWSGRLAQSMRTYQALDAEKPDDPEVLAGMADLLSWSGRKAEALALYKRAETAGPERPELLAPLARLAPLADPVAAAGADYFRDSGKVETWRSSLRVEPGEAQPRGLAAMLIREEVSGRVDGEERSLRTMGAAAGWDGLVTAGLRFRALAGATWTEEERARTWSETRLSLRTLYRFSLDLVHTFRDRGLDLASVRARRDGLTGHEIGISSYRSFTADSGLFLRVRGGSLSDGNDYRGADASFDATLLKRPGASWLSTGRGILALYALDYSSGSDRYYAAQGEWSAAAGLKLAIFQTRGIKLEGSFKMGRAGNESGQGEVLGGGAEARWALNPARVLEAGYSYDQSIQAGTYIWRTWRLALRWGF